ncbi:hypothetical protein ACFWU3_22560 [Streptomyces sp. NPDC058685]|uniref:hypothetical protein n=1 Tax=Streptomyces sp. NPDC058685 TaxID=3346598 RepID=UPI00365B6AE6
MLTSRHLAEWVSARYGPRHAEGRIRDLGFAWSVDTQPDAYLDGDTSAMTYGNGPDIVVKRTGAVWQFGSSPMMLPLYEARTEEELRRAMAKLMPGADLDRPRETVPAPARASAPPPAPPPAPAPSPFLTPAADVPGPAAAPPMVGAPGTVPAPTGVFGAPYEPAPPPGPAPAAAPVPPAPMPPAPAPASWPAPEPALAPAPAAGPEFAAADTRNAVLVDPQGVCFDQEGRHAAFAWPEIRTVHHTVRGTCLMVGVVHANGAFYECRVSARRQARVREWSAHLPHVLAFYLAGRPA